jgi:hypothetical protein
VDYDAVSPVQPVNFAIVRQANAGNAKYVGSYHATPALGDEGKRAIWIEGVPHPEVYYDHHDQGMTTARVVGINLCHEPNEAAKVKGSAGVGGSKGACDERAYDAALWEEEEQGRELEIPKDMSIPRFTEVSFDEGHGIVCVCSDSGGLWALYY